MLAEQTLLNAAVLTVDATSTNAALAGFVFNVLLIARAPLQLFQAVQTSLLPHLAGLNATDGHDEFARAIRVTLLAIAGFAGAVALGLLAIGPWVMDLALRRRLRLRPRRPGARRARAWAATSPPAPSTRPPSPAAASAPAAACWLAAAVGFVVWLVLPGRRRPGPARRDRLPRRDRGALRDARPRRGPRRRPSSGATTFTITAATAAIGTAIAAPMMPAVMPPIVTESRIASGWRSIWRPTISRVEDVALELSGRGRSRRRRAARRPGRRAPARRARRRRRPTHAPTTGMKAAKKVRTASGTTIGTPMSDSAMAIPTASTTATKTTPRDVLRRGRPTTRCPPRSRRGGAARGRGAAPSPTAAGRP